MPDDEPQQPAADGDATRWMRVDAVFSALLELPPEARDAAVDDHCDGDADLAAAVRRLLQAERRSARSFDSAAASMHALADEALLAADDQSLPESVRQIGPYRLTERLGAGGMSVVWKAERNDGEFQQTVAVKLLRRWIESDESVQRFREERRILAGLEHANLARLLDGGVVADGWPYFIMEYVDGEPITEYCDRRKLTVDARLALLQQVLAVVQYAHRRLVVHRDLKPSNILVTAAGQVKLLDFGIAKVLDDEASHATASELTVAGGRLLTPAFASPEQITGDSVSTATDVYAIGVLLYHLLTGRSPYRVDAAQPARLQDAVLTQMPTNPSARVLEPGDAADAAARLAAQRGTTPHRLARTLRGDLDVICQVALRKEPERRYASVEQLAADLERHGQRLPVLARAGNWRYRAGRFARRHAWALAAGIGLPVAAVAALLTHADRLGTERDRAAAAAERAEREAVRAGQVTEYLVELFRAADPAQSGGREVTAVELVDRGIERTDALPDDPALQAGMLRVLGQVSQALGQYQRADEVLLRALSTLEGADDAVGVRRGDVLADLGYTNFQLGRLEAAEQYNRSALASLPAD
ncbi:MAG: serine/threonine-protein kinase, partial [Pseudomonadales bacterium]